MLRLTEIKLPLDHPEGALREAVLQRLGIADAELLGVHVHKRSYDARKRSAIVLIYSVDVELAEGVEARLGGRRIAHVAGSPDMRYRFVTQAPRTLALRPVIIGFGPCGLFAALILAQMGFRPIVLERGKAVRERTRDTFGLWRTSRLDPESNVQFGEGGAGTFSDGKLWSQIKDPHHYGRKVLEEFVAATFACWEKRVPFGIYNVTNPGEVTTRQVVDLIKKTGVSNKAFKFFSDEAEFMRTAAKTPRSNCTMDSSKLAATGIKMTEVHEAIERDLRRWVKATA